MKDYLQVLLSALTDTPPTVELRVGEKTDCYIIHTTEVGRVMGKQGRNIEAIRHLTYCHAKQIKAEKRIMILFNHES